MPGGVGLLTGRVLCDIPNSPRSRFLYRGVKFLRRGQERTAVRCALGVHVQMLFSSIMYICHLHMLFATARLPFGNARNQIDFFFSQNDDVHTNTRALPVDVAAHFPRRIYLQVSITRCLNMDQFLGRHRMLGPVEFFEETRNTVSCALFSGLKVSKA